MSSWRVSAQPSQLHPEGDSGEHHLWVHHGPQCHTQPSVVSFGSWVEGFAPLPTSSMSMPRLGWCSGFWPFFCLPGFLVQYFFQEGFPGSSVLNSFAFENVCLLLASRRTPGASQMCFPPGCFRVCFVVSSLHDQFHGLSPCRLFAFPWLCA